MGTAAALVRPRMKGLKPFEETNNKRNAPSHKTITAAGMTSLREQLPYRRSCEKIKIQADFLCAVVDFNSPQPSIEP